MLKKTFPADYLLAQEAEIQTIVDRFAQEAPTGDAAARLEVVLLVDFYHAVHTWSRFSLCLGIKPIQNSKNSVANCFWKDHLNKSAAQKDSLALTA